jgi:hypothetical protein
MTVMRILQTAIKVGAALFVSTCARAGALPPDVRPNHWAAPAVTRALTAGILKVQQDGKFHGDAQVTRLEAVTTLAQVAKSLTSGTWKPDGPSRPVPNSVNTIWEKTDWKTSPVRRYAFAAIVTRFADYFSNAIKRPTPDAKVGQSVVFAEVPVQLPQTSPGYDSVKYLAANHMMKAGSPLLKPNASPILGAELSRALREMAAGANNMMTDLGKDADGSTNDDAFRKQPGK